MRASSLSFMLAPGLHGKCHDHNLQHACQPAPPALLTSSCVLAFQLLHLAVTLCPTPQVHSLTHSLWWNPRKLTSEDSFWLPLGSSCWWDTGRGQAGEVSSAFLTGPWAHSLQSPGVEFPPPGSQRRLPAPWTFLHLYTGPSFSSFQVQAERGLFPQGASPISCFLFVFVSVLLCLQACRS